MQFLFLYLAITLIVFTRYSVLRCRHECTKAVNCPLKHYHGLRRWYGIQLFAVSEALATLTFVWYTLWRHSSLSHSFSFLAVNPSRSSDPHVGAQSSWLYPPWREVVHSHSVKHPTPKYKYMEMFPTTPYRSAVPCHYALFDHTHSFSHSRKLSVRYSLVGTLPVHGDMLNLRAVEQLTARWPRK